MKVIKSAPCRGSVHYWENTTSLQNSIKKESICRILAVFFRTENIRRVDRNLQLSGWMTDILWIKDFRFYKIKLHVCVCLVGRGGGGGCSFEHHLNLTPPPPPPPPRTPHHFKYPQKEILVPKNTEYNRHRSWQNAIPFFFLLFFSSKNCIIYLTISTFMYGRTAVARGLRMKCKFFHSLSHQITTDECSIIINMMWIIHFYLLESSSGMCCKWGFPWRCPGRRGVDYVIFFQVPHETR